MGWAGMACRHMVNHQHCPDLGPDCSAPVLAGSLQSSRQFNRERGRVGNALAASLEQNRAMVRPQADVSPKPFSKHAPSVSDGSQRAMPIHGGRTFDRSTTSPSAISRKPPVYPRSSHARRAVTCSRGLHQVVILRQLASVDVHARCGQHCRGQRSQTSRSSKSESETLQ